VESAAATRNLNVDVSPSIVSAVVAITVTKLIPCSRNIGSGRLKGQAVAVEVMKADVPACQVYVGAKIATNTHKSMVPQQIPRGMATLDGQPDRHGHGCGKMCFPVGK